MLNTLISKLNGDKDDCVKITVEEFSEIDRGILVNLNGYIDTYNSTYFQNQMLKVLECGYINIVFECSKLSYMSSSGIGAFIFLINKVKLSNGHIILLSVNDKINEVLQLLGFSQFFNLLDSKEDAIKFFKKDNETKSIFPKVIKCPKCSKNLKIVKAGRFRCSSCNLILLIKTNGTITIE